MALLNQTQVEYYEGDNFGSYQFISLDDIITNFMIAYVGEHKIIPKIKRTDVAFHAQRSIQELSFDTFRSIKTQEILLPPSNTMILPQDYVGYNRVLWIDGDGIKRPLYPTKHTQNPYPSLYQNSNGEYRIDPVGTLTLNSNVVVLDGDYSNVLVHGMRVVSPNLPNASYIHLVTTTAGITSITLKNKTGASDKNALLSTNERLEITRFNYLGNGLRLAHSTLTETTTTATGNIGDTQLNLTSVDGIEVGMFINHPSFVNDNDVDGGNSAIKVVGVGSSTVELSHPASFAIGSGDTVGFISNNTNSTTWNRYNSDAESDDDVQAFNYDTDIYDFNLGQRYGLEPSHAQSNGSYFIDNLRGLIHFSSNMSGKTIVLDYISDGLGTDEEMIVHKFAEEAMYKSIAYAILSTTIAGQQLVPRFKKEKFAAIRQAKLRLSNIKIEEFTQVMRGKSKWIKH